MNLYRLERFDGIIFICGFMGTGKSTIGKGLAEKLDRHFIDLDKLIERNEGRTIKSIFENEGESYFRMKEWEYLLDLTKGFKGVIALGGGALHNQQVVDHLKLHGLIVFIDTPMEVIVDRVMRNKKRPIVLDKHGKIKSRETLFTELKSLYSTREALYEQAQVKIRTDGHGKKEAVVSELITKLSRHV